MRIVWNNEEGTFELEFDKSNFQMDLNAAKGAGFKTTGPPDWVWYTSKVKPLKWLKENRPPILIITDEARQKFSERCIWEEENEKNKKFVKKAKAEARKSRPIKREEGPKYEISYIKYVPPPPPITLCIYCYDPVYPPLEQIEPLPVCLWCSKTISDLQSGPEST
jgi:hypothetical protein